MATDKELAAQVHARLDDLVDSLNLATNAGLHISDVTIFPIESKQVPGTVRYINTRWFGKVQIDRIISELEF